MWLRMTRAVDAAAAATDKTCKTDDFPYSFSRRSLSHSAPGPRWQPCVAVLIESTPSRSAA